MSKHRPRWYYVLPVIVLLAPCFSITVAADLRRDFADPPLDNKSRPLWFWNGPLSTAGIREQIQKSRDLSGYYGFGILPTPAMTPAYQSAEFLDRYADAVETAASLGMKMCLYDEFWFPSGSAGGLLAAKYPDATAKRLDMVEETVAGPAAYAKAIPPGTLMGVVAMNEATKQRIDLSGRVKAGSLAWDAPAGRWKLMIFVCVRDGWDHVDYLEPEAVKRFIELTYQRFYDRFPKHFGKTIDSAFYDEPTFWQVKGGRTWTERFNERFQAKHGYSPVAYYPALWHDIGPDTEAARHALFGFRAELFATGFVKTVNDWCAAHGIRLTGHVDQEEMVNPTGLCGDLIKAFQHQDIPGVDEIFQYGRASRAYKLVSSAAVNYDRPLVMTETYGAMKDMDPAILYREAMDQYAKGINLMVPHAVWYNPTAIIFPPELSYRHPTYGPLLPEYNQYIGRLNLLLQSGGHVADVAVLYPIATLQAGYRFGVGNPYHGEPVPEEADYMQLGDLLSLGLRRDFTFLHPEVLDARCTVRGPLLTLDNKLHAQQYHVLILPGAKTIAWRTLEKVKRLVDQGGRVIATTRLPHKSAEFGHDQDVRAAIRVLFGIDPAAPTAPPSEPVTKTHSGGGKTWFLPKPTEAALRQALDDALPVGDVMIEGRPALSGGNFSYLHKRDGSRHIFFLANSSNTPIDTHVRLRGKHRLESWDPHTGKIQPAEQSAAMDYGQPVTRVRLVLPPVKSVFFVGSLQNDC